MKTSFVGYHILKQQFYRKVVFMFNPEYMEVQTPCAACAICATCAACLADGPIPDLEGIGVYGGFAAFAW
jgi:hypothetical protein